jgi:hypothetical protein
VRSVYHGRHTALSKMLTHPFAAAACFAVCNVHSQPKKAPLIDRLGGPSAVRTAVDKFYVKVRHMQCGL